MKLIKYCPLKPLLDEFSSHNARMGFCTRMFDKGYDVETIAKILGARSLTLLQAKYIGFDEEGLKRKVATVMAQEQQRKQE